MFLLAFNTSKFDFNPVILYGVHLTLNLFSGEPKRPKKGVQKGAGETNQQSPAAFQQPKKDREAFRKALVDIIM